MFVCNALGLLPTHYCLYANKVLYISKSILWLTPTISYALCHRVFSRNFQEESQGPLHFWIRGPKQNFCHRKFIYTVMSCQSCVSQGRIAFHFLLPKLIFCVKYTIFCVNENPAYNMLKFLKLTQDHWDKFWLRYLH